jgi:hypothetical protein
MHDPLLLRRPRPAVAAMERQAGLERKVREVVSRGAAQGFGKRALPAERPPTIVYRLYRLSCRGASASPKLLKIQIKLEPDR